MPQVLALPAGHHRRDGALRQRLQLLDVPPGHGSGVGHEKSEKKGCFIDIHGISWNMDEDGILKKNGILS